MATIIDGKVYDLQRFFDEHGHPGGTTMLLFEGTDASVAYHSIHPNHPREYGKIHKALLPFCIGEAPCRRSSRPLRSMNTCNDGYTFNSAFANDLIATVNSVIRSVHKRDIQLLRRWYYIRCILYTFAFVYTAWLWMFTPNALTAIAFGTAKACMALNIAHDGSHGAIGDVSKVASRVFDLIGASSLLWFQQHIMRHHPFTNDYACDKDVSSSEPVLYFSIKERPKRNLLVKFQYILWPIWFQMYAIIVMAESLSMKKYSDTTVNRATIINAKAFLPLRLATKLMWIFVPFFNSHYSTLQYCLHFYIMSATVSLILTTLFMVSHNFVGSVREKGGMVCWYTQQAESSCTYGGRWAGFLTGGLNYQIEHHLFPKLPSYVYPIIHPYIRALCTKHCVRYTYFPTFGDNLRSTIKYLQQ